jgi:hypothetical protein
MYVPTWLIQALLAVGAVAVGWLAKDALGGTASSSAEPMPSGDAEEADDEDADDELVAALTALAEDDEAPAPAPVELTLVVGGGFPGAPGPTGVPISTTVGGPAAGDAARSSEASAGEAAAGDRSAGDASAGVRSLGDVGAGRLAGGRSAAVPGAGVAGRPFWRAMLHDVAAPRSVPAAAPGGTATTPVGTMAVGGWPGGAGQSLSLSPEAVTTAIGDHIVIAYDDSIVLVGDNGVLTGNTGDAGQGGVVALDAQGSAFTTWAGPTTSAAVPGGSAATLTTGGPGTVPEAGGATVAADGAMTALGGGTTPGGPAIGAGASPLVSPIVSFSQGRPVDIAGYEDHSISVRGQRNLVTYDDSNVFIDRDGKINANTGDLDSAGLNAVDTVRSNVSAGPHCDDGCDDESIIQARAGVFDEGDVALDANGNPVWAPGYDAGAPAGDADEGDDSAPGDTGDDDDAEDDESEDGDVSDPVEPPEPPEPSDPPAPGTPAPAPADDQLVIGGDGYDDLGVRVDGVDNTVTYDDSNVVIGGTGDVNAQVGDADTGGTAVMDTVDSEAHGGVSR